MAGKYQSYSECKNSGVEWLGDIPEGWQTQRLGALLQERGETNQGPVTDNILSVLKDVGVIPYDEKGDIGNKKSDDIERYKVVHPGDLVVNSMNVIIGSVGVSKYLGALSPVYLVLHPRDKDLLHPSYLGYIFQIKTFQRWLKRLGYGILDHRLRIPMDNLKKEFLPLPPPKEQRTIAAFLDHETARIDLLIDKQQRLIELLKEKRQALISHAVTKGLDPNVPMKDSGVEWLGQVPEHWSLSQPRYLCQFFGGGTPSKDNPDFWNGDIPWISPKDMKREVIAEAIDSITMDAVRHSSTKLVPVESILIVVRGMILAHSVPVAITSAPVTINQDMKAMVCNGRIEPNYYLLCLQGLRSTILDLVDSSAHGTKCLRTEQFEQVYIPLPPIEEQKAIVATVKYRLKRMDKTIVAASKSIELARERRTALISAAVTGKIDVRNWQPNTSINVAASDLPMAAEQAAEYRV